MYIPLLWNNRSSLPDMQYKRKRRQREHKVQIRPFDHIQNISIL